MSILRLTGSTSGYSQITPPAIAGDQTFTLPGTGGTLDCLERAGNILQVVNATYSTSTSSSSSTFADTGLTASITPTSASSKILVLVNQVGCGKETNNTWLSLRLVRNSTTILNYERFAGANGSSSTNFGGSCSASYLDSPATTSVTTYKTQFASGNNNAIVYVQVTQGGVDSASTITLLEVAA
jgi:hypothetical protein